MFVKQLLQSTTTILLILCGSTNVLGQQWDVIHHNGFELRQKNTFVSGHSLMDNPYADYLANIHDSQGISHQWNQQIGIGSPIRVRTSGNQAPPNNWAGYRTGKNRDTVDMDVIAELNNPGTIGSNAQYDALLITERHDILDVLRWEHTTSLLHHYHNRLLAGNSQGETYLYQSWLHIDPQNPADWIDFEQQMLTAWECSAEKVNLTLASEGKTPAINVIPAGWALTHLLQLILSNEVPGFEGTPAERVDALFSDQVHLNPVGVYYLSAFSFAIINRESPQGAWAPGDLSADTTYVLQQIAANFAQIYLTNYRPPSMADCRTHMVNDLCARYFNFTNRPDQIQSCEFWMNNTGFSHNPFNWPDPNLVVWPDP